MVQMCVQARTKSSMNLAERNVEPTSHTKLFGKSRTSVSNRCCRVNRRDGMHAIDLGAIIRLILAILRKFFECVERILDMERLAGKKLGERMRQCLARREGPDGQW